MERATADNQDNPDPAPGKAGAVFHERLYVPWWHWVLPIVAAALLGAEIHMGFPVIPAWLPYLVTIPVAVFAMIRLGRVTVDVKDGELWVGDAHLPLRFVGAVAALSGTDKRKALGPYLDPTAFVLHRGWVPSVVRVELTDPADPTPYWLISVRRPEKLIAVLAPGS